MFKDYYVYGYYRPDGTPYYIGKGCDNRISSKHRNVKVPPKEYQKKIQENLTERESFEVERRLIEIYGREIDGGCLLNKALPSAKKVNQKDNYGSWARSVGMKQVTLWVTSEEREDFMNVCKAEGTSLSASIRKYMREVIADERIEEGNGAPNSEIGILRRRLSLIESILEKHEIQ